MSALETLLRHYEAREVTGDGRPIVGYLGPDVPCELVAASGFLPLRLRGSRRPSAVADAILGRVEITARRVLTELLESPPCDFVLLAHSSDAAVRLYTSLRRLDGGRLPEVDFLDLLHLPTATSAAYDLDRLRELRDLLGRWSGTPASAESLAAAVVAANRSRRLLARVRELRRSSPPVLTGAQALAVIGAGTALPADRYNALIEDLLAEAAEVLPEPGRRVYLTGSSHAFPELYLALESEGAQVVGEDHDWGEALADGLVDETGDPLAALAARYHAGSPLARRGTNERAVHAAAEAAAAGADVVVAWLREGDDALAWGLPAVRREVETRGLRFEVVEHRGPGTEGAAELSRAL